jgi:hypothetical protein
MTTPTSPDPLPAESHSAPLPWPAVLNGDGDGDGEVSRSSRVRSVLSILAFVVLGAGFGYLLGGWIGGDSPDAAPSSWEPGLVDFAVLVPVLVLAMGLVLLVHELGHLVGGRLAGFRFLLLVIGPARIERRREGVTFFWNRSVALAGGLAASIPPPELLDEGGAKLRRGLLSMIAGGPVASLLLGLGALVPTLGWEPPPGRVDLWGLSALSALAWGSLAIFVVTLIPAKTGGFLTDGARLLRLLRGGRVALRDDAVLVLIAASMGGSRPREWPAALVETALDAPDESDDSPFPVMAHQLVAAHFADRGERSASREHLRLALEGLGRLPPMSRPPLMLAAAWSEAMDRGERSDAVAARRWFDAAGDGPLIPETTRLRTEAAVLFAEGRLDEASAAVEAARSVLGESIDRGFARAEEDWLDGLDGRIAAARG